MAGDEQKEKKVRTTPTNTSLLPPCKVCQEPAAGFHYGVNTCEACKGFFRRSLIRDKPYTCMGNGNCNIRAKKRHICPKCRYHKCLAVGMSKEAIKTGRYTHAKRTQDILEYQEMMGKSVVNSAFPAMPRSSIPTVHHSDSSKPSSPSVSDCSSQISDAAYSPPSPADSLVASVSSDSAGGQMDGLLEPTESDCPLSVALKRMEEIHEGVASSSSSSSSSSSTATSSSLVDSGHVSSSQAGAEAGSSSSLELGRGVSGSRPSAERLKSVTGSSQSLEVLGSSSHSSSPSADSETVCEAPQSHLSPSPVVSPSSSNCSSFQGEGVLPLQPPPSERRVKVLSDEECAAIVRQLVAADESINTMPVNGMSDQQLLGNQLACHEACKANAELFHCKPLSKEEYMDFYSKTGMDVDNRQWLMENHLIPMLDQAIRKYITFCKTIPGFSGLSFGDQANLIKSNRCEFRMLCSFRYYNPQLQVMTLESGCSVCLHEMAKIVGAEHVLQRFQCAEAIRALGLSQEEVVLLKALMVTTAGAENLEDPAEVSSIQWQMAQCLLWVLRQHRPHPNTTFARIVSKMCYVREQSVGFYLWLKSNPVELFAPLRENALMAEWFSNV